MPPLVEDLEAALASYRAEGPRDAASVDRFHDLLRRTADPFARDATEHVTASAVIADPSLGRFLLVWHRRLERWLQPGGHVEAGDTTTWDTARREAREETGVEKLLAPFGKSLLDLDVHDVPPKGGRPAHVHFDLRYLLTAVPSALTVRTEEVRAAEWFSLEAALAAGADASLTDALRKATRIFSPESPESDLGEESVRRQ